MWLLRQADACRRGITRHPRFVEISGATITPRRLFAYDTYQFKDYAKYESSIFSEPHKAAWRSVSVAIITP